MGVPPPPVDPRGFDEIVEQTRAAVRAALGLGKPDPGKGPGVPGDGLIHIFARLAEIVSERINRVPEKNLLAFLSLLGIDRQPPQPARVPLTFELAKGATSGRVPAGTTAAATPVEGEEQAPTYETERDLVLTAARPVAAFVREPAFDRYRDASAVLAEGAVAVPVFEGDRPIGHELYIGDRLLGLPRSKGLTLRFAPGGAKSPAWPRALSWSVFDGAEWQPLKAPAVAPEGGAWMVTFSGLDGIAPSPVAGRSQSWLRARLLTPLPPPDEGAGAQVGPLTVRQQDLPLDAAVRGDTPLDLDRPLAPFAAGAMSPAFLVACDRAFSKPGATIRISVELDESVTPVATDNLTLRWIAPADGTSGDPFATSSSQAAPAPKPPYCFKDETEAFTYSGVIEFHAPERWTAEWWAGVQACWLRVEVATGEFTVAPVLRRLSVSYEWDQPWVTSLKREVSIAPATSLAPDLIALDDTPLDGSKDFLPLGEEPAFNDAFYIACDEALSLPGNRVTLWFTATRSLSEDVAKRYHPEVTWEVYDAALASWRPEVPIEDGTYAFTFRHVEKDDAGEDKDVVNLVGRVTLVTPAHPGPVELGGVPRYCLRARLTDGSYGEPAIFASGSDPIAATLEPPSIARLVIDYGFTSPTASPDAVVTINDSEPSAPSSEFAPFTVTRDRRPTFYLGADGDVASSATMLFLDVAPAAASGRTAPPSEPAAVAWEYRTAAGWRPLGTRDETRAFAGRGLLTFIVPADIVHSTEFGVEAQWLRARWERGEYLAPPRLGRVLTNAMWASNVQTVRDELLGSATGDEHQTFRTARAPILPGQQIDVRELGTPSGAERVTILAEEGDDAVRPVPAEPGRPAESWVRWHEVVDFYASDSRSRHYIVDRLGGELRFGDGRRGMAPPQGRANVRATRYQTGGGTRGNRPAGAITQLKTAVPSVAAVTNAFPAAAGADAEPIEAVRERGPRILRHGGRAVTIGDVEDLAREASAAVARALGVPATSSVDAGGVGVVVVPASDARQPAPSLDLLERVRAHLERRLPVGAALWVGGPGWARIDVTAEVVPALPEQAAEVASAVREGLERFLHPLAGGPRGDGWAFGQAPRRSDVVALIEGITGVDHVRDLDLSATQTVDEPAPGATLPFCGERSITTAMEGAAA